ncbi:helix-turn-helix domain-containing protein [Streptomyces bohaiensis]|uniref:AlbA family DNA-binding domain-containing protein n=1 Tax=Streptomyces bohaiensis TaxID=1431344 RepID=UPI003B7877B5
MYLSARTPRWTPRTEADLQAAIDNGALEEGPHLDLKEAIPLKPSSNKGLARDFAAFAIEGGTLIVGVREDKKARAFSLAPQPLKQLPERLEQIAGRIDPPVQIYTDEIPAAAADGTGYLVVHIPPSADAPHMVDGRYPGRGDKTNHTLTDAQVAELHRRRTLTHDDALTHIRTDMANDPLRGVTTTARFFLAARPTAGRRNLFLAHTNGHDWAQRLNETIDSVVRDRALSIVLPEADPENGLTAFTHSYRRARGVALSYGLTSDRQYRPRPGEDHPELATDLHLLEDGTLRLYTTGIAYDSSELSHLLVDGNMVALTRHTLALLRKLSEQVGYRGSWVLAVAVADLRGHRSAAERQRYSEDTYEESTVASYLDLSQNAGPVTGRLLGPLLRSLGSEERHQQALAPDDRSDEPAPT